MKIGILTFHCVINYGAVLQTYGLQEYLERMGHEVYVIDYCPGYLKKPYRIFDWKWSSDFSVLMNIYYMLRKLLTVPMRMKRKIVFKLFLNRHINLYPCTLNSKHTDFDVFVIGSDQVWNPVITLGLDKVYFGVFPLAQGKKIISYAASAGSISNLKSYIDELRSLAISFDAISVRERQLADFMTSQIVDMPVSVVVDPVLLLGKSAFMSMSLPSKKKRPYILVFQLYYMESYILQKLINILVQEKGIDVVKLAASSESLLKKDLLSMESPEGFLSLFLNASYIVTSSFHGTAFAILFEKDFNVVEVSEAQSERMTDFLGVLGLKNRLVIDESRIVTDKINYSDVNARLDAWRESSVEYLKTALLVDSHE